MRLWVPDAGVVLSTPLLCMETSKSIQEKLEDIKLTESASFLPSFLVMNLLGRKRHSMPLGRHWAFTGGTEGFIGEST